MVLNNAMCLQWIRSPKGLVTLPIAFDEAVFCFSYAIPNETNTQGVRMNNITTSSFSIAGIGSPQPSYAWVMIIGK